MHDICRIIDRWRVVSFAGDVLSYLNSCVVFLDIVKQKTLKCNKNGDIKQTKALGLACNNVVLATTIKRMKSDYKFNSVW